MTYREDYEKIFENVWNGVIDRRRQLKADLDNVYEEDPATSSNLLEEMVHLNERMQFLGEVRERFIGIVRTHRAANDLIEEIRARLDTLRDLVADARASKEEISVEEFHKLQSLFNETMERSDYELDLATLAPHDVEALLDIIDGKGAPESTETAAPPVGEPERDEPAAVDAGDPASEEPVAGAFPDGGISFEPTVQSGHLEEASLSGSLNEPVTSGEAPEAPVALSPDGGGGLSAETDTESLWNDEEAIFADEVLEQSSADPTPSQESTGETGALSPSDGPEVDGLEMDDLLITDDGSEELASEPAPETAAAPPEEPSPDAGSDEDFDDLLFVDEVK